MLEDVKLVQLMFDSIGQVPTEEEREAWQRIKKTALESCQQSGEAPVQQLKAEIRSLIQRYKSADRKIDFLIWFGTQIKRLSELSAV
jgi:16S rRNA U1498 N3-methylase RsmE